MFRHHKYCVIEVSGQLVTETNSQGDPCLYLLDESATSNDEHQRLHIADAEFSAFIRHYCSTPKCINPTRLNARITGTVDLDAQPVSLLGITRALLQEAAGWQTYQPGTQT